MKMDDTSTLNRNVFVYGTLRSTEGNHRVLKNLDHQFLSTGQIKGEVFPTRYGYPCLMEGLGLVDGEIYATNDQGVKVLDEFEGHPNFYERREVETTSGLKVSVYFGKEVQAGIIQA